ncbi:hypothetical protein [Halosimplex salinum]|uniref:hypothetical protein n=1 Tax=Halosimplex salinum TaxID=1710538 RepID=UPI000F49BB3B|nr:hypothetical protein [Halosimplex salinum]
MKRTVAILAMLVVSAIAPVTALAGTADRQAYAGNHVAFDTQSTAVVDYRVDGEQTVDSVRVQSQSEAESAVGLDGSAGLDAVAGMVGAAVSLDAETDASASLTTDSGASVEAHDNGHGSLVVAADESAQYVALNVSDDDAERVDDGRVVFETEGDATATAMVVGEGNVSVTDDGNLTAAVAEDSRLVVRSYTDGRTDDDEREERLIANETAAASVYVMSQGEQRVTDVVTYGQDTAVEVEERAAGRVDMTVERSAHEGRVVLTHVSDETFESASDVQVAVDGEAAASASSYAELRRATEGGDTSKYMVRQSSEASADATVLVGVNHFSTRAVTLTDSSADDSGTDASDGTDSSATDSPDGTDSDSSDSSDDGDASDGDAADDESATVATTSGDGAGFGAVVALLALAALMGVAVVRRH